MIILIVILLGIIAALLLRKTSVSYENAQAKAGDITTYYSFSGNIDTKNRQTVLAGKIMQISEISVTKGQSVEKDALLLKSTAGDQIKAKISGEIVSIDVQENEQVMAGTKLMELVDYHHLEVAVKVDEYDIAALKTGQQATVKIGAGNKELQGKIDSISREGQIADGVTYFMATIVLPEDSSIRIGMTAEVKLIRDQAKGVVTLPMVAIQFDENNKPYILKGNETEQPVKTEITLGINDGTTVEIQSGVTAGETVLYHQTALTENTGFLRDSDNSGGGNINPDGGNGNARNT